MAKFEKLSRSTKEDTKIMAGHQSFTVEQLENEIKMDSDIGKKLKTVEKELEERF